MQTWVNENTNKGNESDSDFIEVSPVDIKSDQELITDKLQSNVGSVTSSVQKLDQRVTKLQKAVSKLDEGLVQRIDNVTVSVLDARRVASLQKRTSEESIKEIASRVEGVKEELAADMSQIKGSLHNLQKTTKQAQHQIVERMSLVENTTTEAIKDTESLEITLSRLSTKMAATDLAVSRQLAGATKLASNVQAIMLENSTLRSRLAEMEAKSIEQERKQELQQQQIDREFNEMRMDMQRQKSHMLACEAVMRRSQQTLAAQTEAQVLGVQTVAALTSKVEVIQGKHQNLEMEVASLANAQRHANATKRIIARDCQDLNDKVSSEAQCLNNLGSAVAAFAKSSCSQILELKRDVARLSHSLETTGGSITGPSESSTSTKERISHMRSRWLSSDDMPFYGSATPVTFRTEHDERICFGFGDAVSRCTARQVAKTSAGSQAPALLDSPLPKIQSFGKVMSPIKPSEDSRISVSLRHALTAQEGFSDRFVLHLNQSTALVTEHVMSIHPSESIADFKRSVMIALPVIGSNFELLHNGAQLPEHKLIKQCGIEPSSDILIAIIA
jgi:hypothetical protein